MRFLLTTPADASAKAGAPPDPKLMAEIGRLAGELTQKGVLRETGGLSSKNVRLSLTGGAVRVIDGPYTEAKELIGGYAIVDVPSEADAVALAKRFLQVHRDVLGPTYESESEVRRLFTPADFGPPPAAR